MKIQNLEDLAAALRSKKPGDSVEIIILRNSQPLTLKATLRLRNTPPATLFDILLIGLAF